MRGSLSGEKEEKKENEEKRDSLSTAGGTTWLLEKDTLHEMVTTMQLRIVTILRWFFYVE